MVSFTAPIIRLRPKQTSLLIHSASTSNNVAIAVLLSAVPHDPSRRNVLDDEPLITRNREITTMIYSSYAHLYLVIGMLITPQCMPARYYTSADPFNVYSGATDAFFRLNPDQMSARL